jgi:hypothetical protein
MAVSFYWAVTGYHIIDVPEPEVSQVQYSFLRFTLLRFQGMLFKNIPTWNVDAFKPEARLQHLTAYGLSTTLSMCHRRSSERHVYATVLRAMLQRDPQKRMTPEQLKQGMLIASLAIAHRWCSR